KGNDAKGSKIAVHGRVPESEWNKCTVEYSINSEPTSPVLARYVERENSCSGSRASQGPRQACRGAAGSAAIVSAQWLRGHQHGCDRRQGRFVQAHGPQPSPRQATDVLAYHLDSS